MMPRRTGMRAGLPGGRRRLAMGVALELILLAGAAPARADATPVHSHDFEALTNALNLVWVLVAGFLVMFMQVGFAMLETGFTRAKNAVNTMAMNLMIYPISLIGFWLTG